MLARGPAAAWAAQGSAEAQRRHTDGGGRRRARRTGVLGEPTEELRGWEAPERGVTSSPAPGEPWAWCGPEARRPSHHVASREKTVGEAGCWPSA